jgi:hypothetical protein
LREWDQDLQNGRQSFFNNSSFMSAMHRGRVADPTDDEVIRQFGAGNQEF